MKHPFADLLIFIVLFFSSCTKKSEPLVVKFQGPYTEKKWAVKELNPELPSDWSKFGFLTFDMLSSTTQRFELRLIDTAGPRRLTIQPFQGTWIRASIPLVHFQKRNTKGMDMAAIGKTARPGYWIGFSGAVGTINCVDSLSVSRRMPIDTQTLEIKNIRLTIAAEDSILGTVPLVDEFGQWIPAEWHGKAKTLDDLKASWAAEDLSLQTAAEGVSKYGGFLGTKVKATGFFRIEKIKDIWWLVDPEGYLFYSTGSCGINSRSEVARVQGREYIFREMPPAAELAMPGQGPRPGQPAGLAAPGQPQRRFNASFYTWNLFRRYGPEWYNKWMETTSKRMTSWGINTIGNWSDANFGGSHLKAYVATTRGWGIENGVMGLPDIYAPGYAERVDRAALEQCEPRKNDPWLIGYFVGNEQPWPGREQELVKTILEGEATPMQAELKKYLAAGDTPERRRDFVYLTYEKFITTVNKAIKKHDPNHLNLGIRFGGGAPDPVLKASKGFDVFSFNNYGYTVSENNIKRFYDITGLPMIIGEFHFGVPGRGLAPGLAQTRNQEERAAAYSYYVENAASHPAIVGTHWFQWIDQPATGRNDGENYNIGFVDVTDRPYSELINASRTTFSRLLDIHSGKVKPTARQAAKQ